MSRWKALPRRLYLDTGTLQTLYDYGETIWEGEPFVPHRRDAGVEGLTEEVEALRWVMQVNERAGFEFVVTEASLSEVDSEAAPGTRSGSTTCWTRGSSSPRARSRCPRATSGPPA